MIGRALPYVALAAAAAGAFWVYRRGVAGVASDVVNAAGAVVTGTVTGVADNVGQVVGLPTSSQTTQDPRVARWIIDNVGHFEASRWSGAPAYLQAIWLDEGSGIPPSANSDAGRALLPLARTTAASYDETDRLAVRYPAPVTSSPDSIFNPGLFNSSGQSWSQLAGLDGAGFSFLPRPWTPE